MSDIRTPPPVLTGPLTITLDDKALAALNNYRQKYHAWSMHPGFGTKGEQLNLELAEAATELSNAMSALSRRLG